jgi:hypothetical protein
MVRPDLCCGDRRLLLLYLISLNTSEEDFIILVRDRGRGVDRHGERLLVQGCCMWLRSNKALSSTEIVAAGGASRRLMSRRDASFLKGPAIVGSLVVA